MKVKSGIKAIQNTGGLVSAVLSLSENFKNINDPEKNRKILWAGVMDSASENIFHDRIENDKFEISPVLLSHKLNDLYYNGFCNDLIWPLFHYFPSYSNFDSKFFDAFQEANKTFCNELTKVIEPGDFIWIHDYQLMMLPGMIRESIPDATIGFFLHIPFPSFEVLRLLPRTWRKNIVEGMLGADLIGFHTHDYAQYFIRSVKRITGYECRQNLIYTPDKIVKADAFPIGIDYHKFHDASVNKKVLFEKSRIKESLKNQKLIFSVDRLDYSKGLLLRLKGYEAFLENYPSWHSRVVFNMVVVPSRDSIEKYREMKKEIESMVGRINGKFSTLSWRPVIYQYKSLSFDEMVALYDISDVGLITPLRDGMNLVAKEYIASQKQNKGVLILSEMAGASAELTESLIINPVDNEEMAAAIFDALEMRTEEKNRRIGKMQERLQSYNVFTWADDFFNQAYSVKEQQKSMGIIVINNEISSVITSDYRKAKNRMFILDYDGTLVSFAKYPELAVMDQNTLSLLKEILKDKNNNIAIISGRDKGFLEAQFKGMDLTIVAEHGLFIKRPGEEWSRLANSDPHWKKMILPLLNEYVNRCNGAFIEEKEGSLAWHYRNADSDYAQLRLNELKDDLSGIIRYKTDLEILEGHKVLEIKSGRYSKGTAANELMKNRICDFILTAGDDKTDESLFLSVPSYAYTIRIGLNPSHAKYNVRNVSAMLKLLKAITV